MSGSFGYSLLRPERFLRCVLTDESKYSKELKSSRFYSGVEVGKPGARHQLYEVCKRPTRCREKLPVILGFSPHTPFSPNSFSPTYSRLYHSVRSEEGPDYLCLAAQPLSPPYFILHHRRGHNSLSSLL